MASTFGMRRISKTKNDRLSETNRFRCAVVAVAAVVLGFGPSVAIAAHADNVAPNPSAEQVAADDSPVGWGLYVGTEGLKLTSTIYQRHSGKRSACLKATKSNTPPGQADAAVRYSNGAILLAPNNGYSAKGAIPCSPGDDYVFFFWYKGDIPGAVVKVTGWPSADADETKRASIPVLGGAISPSPEWRKCTGRFHVPEGVQRFAVGVHVSVPENKGSAPGKSLYVDDADIRARQYPDGEMRAMALHLRDTSNQRDEGLREIHSSFDRFKAAGFNSVFIYTTSLYLAALEQPEIQKIEPKAAWDALAKMIRAAKERQLEVHLWYSPWIYKDNSWAIELQRHPDWATVSAKGKADPDGVCFVRPEVRQFALDMLAKAIDRYPDLVGIHIEEPGYSWGNDYCYCDYCREFCLQNFAVDIRRDTQAAKPTVHSLAAFMCTDFFLRLHGIMAAKRPDMWLSANGGFGNDLEWYIGRDWHTWSRRGLIDFYIPQLFTKDVQQFTKNGLETKACLGGCDLVTSIGVSWAAISPKRQPPEVIKAEIAAARKLGAKGFVVFMAPFLQDEHFQAVHAAVQEKPAANAKP